jgi:hypothetical protein
MKYNIQAARAWAEDAVFAHEERVDPISDLTDEDRVRCRRAMSDTEMLNAALVILALTTPPLPDA